MSRGVRSPLLDLFCMAYLPASAILRDGPRRAQDEEEYDMMPRPTWPKVPGRLVAAVAAIIAMVAVISVAHVPL